MTNTFFAGEKLRKLLSGSLIVLLGILLAAVSVMAVQEKKENEQNALTLSNDRKALLHEAAASLRSMEDGLSKLMVTNEPAVQSGLLSALSQQGDACAQSLAGLPGVATGIQNTLKFTNQLASYSRTALHTLLAQNKLPGDFDAQIVSFFETCRQVNGELAIAEEQVEKGEISLLTPNDKTAEEGLFASIDADAVEYPAVIFDGPFSDGQTRSTPKQKREPVTREQAAQSLQKWGFDLTFDKEIPGTVGLYQFSGEDITAQVTKEGGLLYLLLSSGTPEATLLSEEEAAAKAEQFVQKLSIGQTALVWREQYADCYVFNFVPLEQGVRMYPELFKVKISAQDGSVLAFEGKNYVMTHCGRTLPEVQVTKEKARALLKPGVDAQEGTLCLISVNEKETLCWEFFGRYHEMNYALYLSAVDGHEVESFRIITTETGNLAV